MLPFLKTKRQDSGIATVYRAPDEGKEQKENDSQGLEVAATDLHSAIESKDIKGIAEALKAAFLILDAMPHEEGEHTNESEE
jgi:hypothetical protein